APPPTPPPRRPGRGRGPRPSGEAPGRPARTPRHDRTGRHHVGRENRTGERRTPDPHGDNEPTAEPSRPTPTCRQNPLQPCHPETTQPRQHESAENEPTRRSRRDSQRDQRRSRYLQQRSHFRCTCGNRAIRLPHPTGSTDTVSMTYEAAEQDEEYYVSVPKLMLADDAATAVGKSRA